MSVETDIISVARGDTLGESPVWSVAEGALYWIDVRRPCLRRLAPATGMEDLWPMPEIIGAVMLAARGRLVLALKSGLALFDPATGAREAIHRLDEGHEGNRCNDSRVDRGGRLWFSTMWDFGRHATGALYRLTADGQVQRLRDGLRIPNGLAFAPDGACVYFTDTADGAILRAPLDARGLPGAWREIAPPDIAPGRPDGATVDAEGCLWQARYGGGCVVRLAPDGRLVQTVPLPVSQPSACAFGGSDLRTLFVTTSRQGLSADDLAREPQAGDLLQLRPGVAGLPEPVFAEGAR